MATASNQALSLNLVLNSAINGTSFLQASVNKLHTYSKKVEKVNLLKATKFPMLNSNIKKLSIGLGGIKRQTAKISANPINLGLTGTNQKLKIVKKDITAIAQKSREARNYSKLWADDLKRGSTYANTKVKQTGGYLSNKAKVGATVTTASVVGAMTTLNPIDKAIKFESAMADVTKATDADKPKTLLIKKEILKTVSQGSLIDPTSLAQIYTGGGKSGISITDLPSYAKTVGMGAVALDIKDYSMAGTMIAQTAEKMNIPIGKVGTLLDAYTQMENKGTQLASKIINTTGRLAGTYSSLGFKTENSVAVSSFMNSIAPSQEVAATWFDMFQKRLLKTNSKFGYYDELKSKGAGGISGIVKNITTTMSRSEILKTFGDEGYSVIDKMNNKISLLDENLGYMSNGKSIGAMAKEYNIKTGTTEARETMARNKTTVSMIGVGDEFKKPYIAVYEATAQAITGVTNFYKSNKELIHTLAPIALGIGATALAIKGISMIASPFIGLTRGVWKFRSQLKTGAIFAYKMALSGLSVASKVAGSALKFMAKGVLWASRALLLNPIGLTLTAIAGAGYLIYKNWDYLKSKTVAIWNGITNAIKSPFVTLFNWIQAKFQAVIGIVNKVKGIASNVSNIGSNALNGVKNGASNIWSNTKNFFGFANEKKESFSTPTMLKPANNINYKTLMNTSTLQDLPIKEMKIPTIPIESVSDITSSQINETKSFMQNHSSSEQKTVTNNNDFTININAPDGIADMEELKEQFINIRREVEHDFMERNYQDNAEERFRYNVS